MAIKLGDAIFLDFETVDPWTGSPMSADSISAWVYKNLETTGMTTDAAATATIVSAFTRNAASGHYGIVVSLPTGADAYWSVGNVYNVWASATVCGVADAGFPIYSFGIASIGVADLSAQISGLNDLSQSGVSAMVNQSLSAYPVALSSQITALNDLSQSGVSAMVNQSLSAYEVATSGQIAALNDIALSSISGEVIAGLTGYPDLSGNSSGLVSAIFNELLTKTKYDVPNSFGRTIRVSVERFAYTGNAISGGDNWIQLNGDSAGDDGSYDPNAITIINGTGAGQSRQIYEYWGSGAEHGDMTRVAWVDRDWKTVPDATSEVIITESSYTPSVNEGVIISAGVGAVVLNTYASTEDNAYKGQMIFFRSGPAQDLARSITAYDGPSRTAYLHMPLPATGSQPVASSTVYSISPNYATLAGFCPNATIELTGYVTTALNSWEAATSGQIAALNDLNQSGVSAMVNQSLSAYEATGVASKNDTSNIDSSAISAAVNLSLSAYEATGVASKIDTDAISSPTAVVALSSISAGVDLSLAAYETCGVAAHTDLTGLSGYLTSAEMLSTLSAYGSSGVADQSYIVNTLVSSITAAVASVDATDIASAVSGAIISGIGAWGDLRWSKIYGIPLDQWDVIIRSSSAQS